MRRHASPRKLLVASIGVATLNYVGACNSSVANLMPPTPQELGKKDAGRDAESDGATDASK